MTVQYRYWQHYVPSTKEYQSLEQALARAKDDMENETAWPEQIILEDGRPLDHDGILVQSGYYSQDEKEEEA